MKAAASSSALQYPKRLEPGGTIGVAAPAGPFNRGQMIAGLKVLEASGFRVHAPEDLAASDGYLAGSDVHRAETVNRLFRDERVDAVICARGGFGSMRILPHLDYALIAANPKVFIGFSDASALLDALYRRCSMVTFHGPVVTSLADASARTVEALLRATGRSETLAITCCGAETVHAGTAVGPVCGGNLSTLCHLLGTPFEPVFRDHIVFLEDCNEAAYRIDRMLSQMKLAGCFDAAAGIVIGSFEGCGPPEGIVKIVRGLGIRAEVPILAGMDAGHGPLNTTLPFGVEATLDAAAGTLTYHRPATNG